MKKEKKRKPFVLKQFVIQTLRRATYRYPPRNEVLKKARVARGLYQCAECGPPKTYKREQVAIDHTDPVVDPDTGFVDWNTYVSRMFPPEEGFSLLCQRHHDIKTDKENRRRKRWRNKEQKNKDRRVAYKVKKLKENPALKSELEDFLSDCGLTEKDK